MTFTTKYILKLCEFAIIIGIIIFSTGFLSHWSDLSNINHILISGYTSLSIYHGFLFGSYKFGDIFSMLSIWLLPFLGIFLMFICLLYGLVVSIPKTIVSALKWRVERDYKKAQKQQSSYQSNISNYQYQYQPKNNQYVKNNVVNFSNSHKRN